MEREALGPGGHPGAAAPGSLLVCAGLGPGSIFLKEAVMEKAAWFLAGFVAGWLVCALLVRRKTLKK